MLRQKINGGLLELSIFVPFRVNGQNEGDENGDLLHMRHGAGTRCAGAEDCACQPSAQLPVVSCKHSYSSAV